MTACFLRQRSVGDFSRAGRGRGFLHPLLAPHAPVAHHLLGCQLRLGRRVFHTGCCLRDLLLQREKPQIHLCSLRGGLSMPPFLTYSTAQRRGRIGARLIVAKTCLLRLSVGKRNRRASAWAGRRRHRPTLTPLLLVRRLVGGTLAARLAVRCSQYQRTNTGAVLTAVRGRKPQMVQGRICLWTRLPTRRVR